MYFDSAPLFDDRLKNKKDKHVPSVMGVCIELKCNSTKNLELIANPFFALAGKRDANECVKLQFKMH